MGLGAPGILPVSSYPVNENRRLEASAPSQLIYENLHFEAERGQRTVLVGPNGAGKSTLLKLLAEVLKPQSGVLKHGHNAKSGYFAQHRAAMLNPKHTVLQEALDTPQRVTEQAVRNVLGNFLFRGDDVFKPVSVLSGGEKSRLALVKLLLNPPNLLLMDEPTTHLDLASVDALIEALKQFEGTMIFISHDVHFIRALANHAVRVETGHLRHFTGGYQYYLDKTSQSARAALTSVWVGTRCRASRLTGRSALTVDPKGAKADGSRAAAGAFAKAAGNPKTHRRAGKRNCGTRSKGKGTGGGTGKAGKLRRRTRDAG